MTYCIKYNTNPSFPYSPSYKKQTNFSLSKILKPIENILGRKIKLEDFLLLGIIYIIFTEKDKENYTLLLCLLFILLD